VAREVRIFPLLGLDRTLSPHVEPILAHCSDKGLSVEVRVVPYEFQRGSDQMLRIKKRSGGGSD
jgi:hypothetical protein